MNEDDVRRRCPVCARSDVVHERTLDEIQLVRCTSCGMVFVHLSKREIEETNARIFAADSRNATNYEWNQTDLDASWFEVLARRYTKALGGGSVLDVGCGNGRLLSYFRSSGWSCTGLDPSPWTRASAGKEGFELLSGFPEDFPERSGSFDLVLSTSTLEHVADPETHIRSMLRFVRPGGFSYLCGVPNYGSWAVRTGTSSFFANKPPIHVNYFTPATLGRLMGKISPPSYRVRTYGIPELHRILYLRRKKRRAGRSEPAPQGLQRRPVPAAKKVAFRLAVHGYYWAGRPLALGDKLELEIVR